MPTITSSPIDEGPSPFVQQNIPRNKLISVLINYLDDTEHTFYVHVSITYILGILSGYAPLEA